MVGFRRYLHRLFGRPPGRPADRASEAPRGQKGTILVIALGQRFCEALARRLEEKDFRVAVVSGEEAGREALEREEPNLVLVHGPASPGFYRLLRRMTSAPILALDPQAQEEQVLAALAGGVDQFQARLVSDDEAVAWILSLLRRVARPGGIIGPEEKP